MSTKPAKARQKQRKDTQQAPLTPLKVVVRHLPPNLPKNIFHTSISPWHKAFDWSDYIAGKLAKSRDKSDRYARAYLHFRKREDLEDFAKRYHGHPFISSDGKEYRALVEIAPYQKVPKPITAAAKSKDVLSGTLAQDPEFKAFLASLEEPVIRVVEETQPAPKITPLIEYLRIQKAKNEAKAKARKARENVTKAKQQEEKQKAAQAQADATTARLREKAEANVKPNAKAANKDANKKSDPTSTEPKKNPRSRQSKTKTSQTPGQAASKQTPDKSQPAGQSKPAPSVVTTPSSLAQQRLPKAQHTTAKQSQSADSKPPKSAKNKRKETKQSGSSGGKAHRNGQSSSHVAAPVDISGPTPAEMAALARAKTKT